MRPDSAVRLLFGAASAAVGRAVRTPQLPDTVGASLQQVAAGIEAACRRVRMAVRTLCVLGFLSMLLLFFRPGKQSELSVTGLGQV